MQKALLGTCIAAFACSASAQLQEFNPQEPLLLPNTDGFTCGNGNLLDPPADIVYFDIRRDPADQPSTQCEGTFLISGDCDLGGSFARGIALSAVCSGDAAFNTPPMTVQFAFAGEPVAPGIPLFGLSGLQEGEVLRAVGFEPGDSVGPDAQWDGSFLTLGEAPLWTRPPQFNSSDDEFRNDRDLIGVEEGVVIGVEILEPTGVHYGWFEIRRSPSASPDTINACSTPYFVARYAYQLTPGVPAVVTPPPCNNPADTNGDGQLTPADFSAWVIAFNQRAEGCDQNGDGICGITDFSPWIQNFNAGC